MTAIKSIITKELTVQNGDKTIYGKIYAPKEDGEYPAIILSHGYNGTNNDWVKECTYYARNGYVAYAYDFCGGSNNSKSSGKSEEMTITSEKSDLLAVFDYISTLDNVDSSQVFMFGGSQGGLVSALAAVERADKVKGLAMYFPALCVPDDWKGKYNSLDDVPETFDFWGVMLGKCFVEDVFNYDVFEQIGSFDKDVLIIHGDRDMIVPLSYSQKAAGETYPHGELVVMPGEGHGFTPAGGQAAMERILEYLQEHTN